MSFLSLPVRIRRKIYDFCLKIDETYRVRLLDEEYLTPIRLLLLTCRKVYAEVAPLWYPTAEITIHCRERDSLQRLLGFPQGCVAALNNLTIHLSHSSCVMSADCCTLGQTSCRGQKHDAPLSRLAPQWDLLLKEWESAIGHLASYAGSHLRIHLICDTTDLETAKEIVRPLYGFPQITECDLRLASEPDQEIRDLAYITAQQIMGRSPTTTFFPFIHLPRELQAHILTFTDLATPYGEVSWTPGVGFYITYGAYGCLDWMMRAGACQRHSPLAHYGCQFRKCLGNSRSTELLRRGCYCRLHHTAFALSCHCWARPTAFFLVSRSFSQIAQEIFYSRNRFVIQPAETWSDRLDISLFFDHAIPLQMRGLIKVVNWVVPLMDPKPYFPYSIANYPDTAFRDWELTLARVAQHFNFSRLTFTAYLEEYTCHPWDLPLTPAEIEGCEKYSSLLQPLARVNVARLFVWAGWHNEFTFPLERRLERSILGSAYDSEQMGKSQHIKIQYAWQWDWPY